MTEKNYIRDIENDYYAGVFMAGSALRKTKMDPLSPEVNKGTNGHTELPPQNTKVHDQGQRLRPFAAENTPPLASEEIIFQESLYFSERG